MLLACPKCQRTFPEGEAAFCPEDASELKPVDAVPAPSDREDPLVGHSLAERYQVRRVVADGSMGRVYEVRELGAERRIAVKVLHPQVAEDSVNLERFRREATTSKELTDHSHVVHVYDFASVPSVPGRSKRTWYLTMEYLDGEELRALLKREKLPGLPRVLRVVSQLALALDPAHAAGFVHRDLKPENVFLVKDGDDVRVKLLDFGSVKFTKGQDRGHKLTVLGTTIGSPYYMAPEQAQGNPDLDHRADTWAVAAIAYEMLVGKVPFQGNNGPQILFKILSDEPEPPTFANDALPAQLDDVLLRGLKKKPEERYQSVGELADALGHAFGLEGSHKDWAATPAAELAKRLPGPKAATAAAPEPAREREPVAAVKEAAKPDSLVPPPPDNTDAFDAVRPKPMAPLVVMGVAALLVIGVVVLLLAR